MMKCCNLSLCYRHPKPAFVYLTSIYQLPPFSRMTTTPTELASICYIKLSVLQGGGKIKCNIDQMRSVARQTKKGFRFLFKTH